MNGVRNKLSVLVITTDRYKNYWEGLLLSWESMANDWVDIYIVSDFERVPDCNNVISLSINNRNYNSNDFSNKVIHGLERIETEYVLLMCDDMWPLISIGYLFHEFIHFMDIRQANSMKIHEPLYNWKLDVYDLINTEFYISGNKVFRQLDTSKWFYSHNATIWNRKYLRSIQRPNENAWDNENNGTLRMKDINSNGHYFYNIYWYIQDHNVTNGILLPYGDWLVEQFKFKKAFFDRITD